MTETDPNSPADLPKPRKTGGDFWWLLLALFIAAGVFAAIFFLPMRDRLVPLASNAPLSQERMNEIERRVQTLEARVNTLEAQIQNIPTAPANTPASELPSSHAAPAADIAHVQSDLAQFASTLGTLQDQVKKTDATAHAVTHAALVRMIAFMQLRDSAMSDHGFAPQLDAMRVATADDPGLKDPLDKLAPYAEKGIPGVALLREELAEQTSAVEVAAAKAGAQNWWERILAELRGLVLIRQLHGGSNQDDILGAMKKALAQDDVGGALNAMKNLPPEAQQTLADWQKQAEARQTIMESLQVIAGRLVADSDANATPASKDAP